MEQIGRMPNSVSKAVDNFCMGVLKRTAKYDLRGSGGYAPRKILNLRSSESESDTFWEDYDRA